jgi:hypothetical protein
VTDLFLLEDIAMKSLIVNSICLGLAAATAMVAGCSSSGSVATTNHPVSSEEVGAVGLRLSLPDGTTISNVQYTLSSGTTTVQSGTLDVSHSQGISFQLGQVPAGSYTRSLSAASTDGGVTCLGTAGPFAVVAHSTATEQVQLICQSAASSNGNIGVTTSTNFCGTWTSVSTVGPGIDAGPTNGSEVLADGVTPIVVSATATGAAPTALAYTWTATTVSGNGVTIHSNVGNGTTSDTLTVTCNTDATDTVGSATLTLVVSDSLDGGAVSCPSALSTVSTTVFCDKIATCTAGTVNCSDAGSLDCQNLQTSNTDCGSCGHACTGGTTCSAGACACPAGTTLCGATCDNLSTDVNNCGACGNVCASGNSCVAGACVAAPKACPGSNPAGTCSPTEQIFATHDPSGVCYACLLNKGCIDDAPAGTIPGVTTFGDTGLECGDLATGSSPGVDGGAESTVQLCLDTLTCAVSSGCGRANAPNAAAATNCYCGSATGTACAGGSGNGACAAIESAAAESTAPTTIIGRTANSAFPVGMADNILQCAISNSCTTCY